MNIASRRPERRGPLAVRILLAFILALLTVHAGQPPHLHKGTTPGAYNEEHVLASLESTTGDVPLADQVPSISIALAAEDAVQAPDRRVSFAFARHADSRGPPLA